MPDNEPYDDVPLLTIAETREAVRLATAEVERLREVIDNLLVAWLNDWEPGANQDLIDEAERAAASGSTAAPKPPQ